MKSSLKVTVIDYGVGNIYSVTNALSSLGYKIKVSREETDIQQADALILPGVGAFEEAIGNLRKFNLESILNEQVLTRKKPIMGICVGMQMLAAGSHENGWHEGLGWIPGEVKKLSLPAGFSVPHVGWNDVHILKQDPMFNRNAERSHFYFDCDDRYKAAVCNYGKQVTAAVLHENICGVQFHPEKSQTSGLKLFRSFLTSI
jgi:imidazole glycerol-phosphate synthase subunit HisH